MARLFYFRNESTGSHEPPRRLQRRLKQGLKLVLVIGLLTLLFRRGGLSINATQDALRQWRLIFPAYLLLLLSYFLSIARWQILLRSQGILLRSWRAVALYFIGGFFGVSLPGSVSGDVIKVYYVAKETRASHGAIILNILLDRMTGLIALVLLATGAFLFNVEAFENIPALRAFRSVSFATLFGILIVGSLLLTKWKEPLVSFLGRFKYCGKIQEGLREAGRHREAILFSIGLSLLIHLLVTTACYLFTLSLGEATLSRKVLFAIVPLGQLSTAIPIMASGIGTGHAAFFALYMLVGSKVGANVFTLLLIHRFLMGSIGGIFYLCEAPRRVLAEAKA